MKAPKAWYPWLLILPVFGSGVLVLGIGFVQALIRSFGWLPSLGLETLSYEPWMKILKNPDTWRNLVYSFLFAFVVSTIAVNAGAYTAFSMVQSKKSKHVKWVWFWIVVAIALPYGVAALASNAFFGQSGFASRVFWHLGWLQEPAQFPVWVHTPAGIGLWWPYFWKGSAFAALALISLYAKVKKQDEPEARTLGAGTHVLYFACYIPKHHKMMSFLNVVIFAYIFGAMEVPVWLGAMDPQLLPGQLYSLFLHPDIKQIPVRMAFMIFMTLTSLALAIVISMGLSKIYQRGFGWRWWAARFFTTFRTKSIFADLYLWIYSLFLSLPLFWLLVYGMTPSLRYPGLVPQFKGIERWLLGWTEDPLIGIALWQGTVVALIVGGLVTAAGCCVSRSMVRHGLERHGWLIAALSLPLFIPLGAMISGIQIASIHLGVANGYWSVILGHVVLSLPYSIGVHSAFQKDFGTLQEDAARTLGAGFVQRFSKVLVPAMAPALSLSFAIGFIISFSETFSTQLLGGGMVTTIGALLGPALEYGDLERGSRIMMLFLAVNGLVYLIASWVNHRNVQRSEYSLSRRV